MIAVVGAFDAEVQAFLETIEGLKTEQNGAFTFHHGRLCGHRIVLAMSGVGKVMAAMTTQKIISSFEPTHILFTGIAGALNPKLDIGDLVVGKEYIQHDMDVRGLGFARGEIPFTGLKILQADPTLVTYAAEFPSSTGKTFTGRILSGDQFITQSGSESHGYLTTEFSGDAIEMEGASVAFVCAMNKTPFVVMRTISDRADHAAAVDFTSFLPTASHQSLDVVRHILAKLG